MAEENTSPKPASAVTERSDEGRSDRDRVPSHQPARPVSSKSEAIIKEVSIRRREAIRILANR